MARTRSASKNFFQGMQRLESRILLSGTVTVADDGVGGITITGDDSANVITVKSGGAGVEVIGKGTQVNGSNKPFFSDPVTGNIVINLNGGNDKLTVQDLSAPGNLTITMGDGNDTTTINDSLIASYLHFEGNAGNNTLSMNNDHVIDTTDADFSSIDLGLGNNKATINNFTDQDLELSAGDGNNTLAMSDSTFLGGTFQRLGITLGNGKNLVTLDDIATSPLTIQFGTGNNVLKIVSSQANTATLTGGGGHDIFILTDDILGTVTETGFSTT